MRKLSLALMLATAAVGLSVPGVAVANKGKSHGAHVKVVHAKKGHHAVHGTVSAVGADSLTLTTKKGDVTVPVNADTKIRVNGNAGTLADILVGYKAEAKLNKDGVAKSIKAGSEKLKSEVHGTVSAVTTDSITLTLKHGFSLTIPVTADTKVRVNHADATIADVKVGFRAEVKRGSDGSATKIDAKDPAFKSEVHGTVSAVGTDSITLTLKHDGGSLTIPVTADTKIHLKCGHGSLSDIQVGFRVHVKRNSDGSARRIQAVDPHFKCEVHGTVSAVGTDSITLTLTHGGSLEVPVTADTKIFVNGATGSLAEILVGYEAKVERSNDGTARRINAHAPH